MRETGRGSRRADKVAGYSAKDRIDHSIYGTGTIVEIDERRTTIAFDESGTRKFVTNMVKLTPSDTPAPARRINRKKKTARSS